MLARERRTAEYCILIDLIGIKVEEGVLVLGGC